MKVSEAIGLGLDPKTAVLIRKRQKRASSVTCASTGL
jgi:hypothetical protein